MKSLSRFSSNSSLFRSSWNAWKNSLFWIVRCREAKSEDTVVVSAASGAVGSVVGQIAKLKGCKTVGIAGGPDKCSFVKEEMGLDHAIDYKSGNLSKNLADACPDGIDIYFENVGGEVSNAVAPLMNEGGRVPICGYISAYNSFNPDMDSRDDLPETPFDVFGSLDPVPEHRFFVVTEYMNQWDEATKELTEWIRKGEIKYKESILEGFENTPQGLRNVLSGKNFGKQLIKI